MTNGTKCIIKPPTPPIVEIHGFDGRVLLSIHTNGTVEGDIEDVSEAARMFVKEIRRLVALPTQSDALRDQLLQECLVKLRDVQGTEAPKQYACNLIKRIERVLQEQSK